jgi:3-hydroxybutyryl-CoA dehydrogenase
MPNAPIRIVSMVGAGFMGRQIAYRCLAHGYEVWLVDESAEALARTSQGLAEDLQAHSELAPRKEEILTRLHATTDLAEGVAQADLVIEATPERLETKREVFARLDALCAERTILATNSSSLRISRIEDVTQRLDRVLNLHFFAPVEVRPVVELMGGSATAPETIERVRQFARSLDMTPLIVRRDSTGFIFNRVWRAVKRECLHLVDQGVASPEDVDRAWIFLYKTPRGPFGDMDMIGLDVIRDIEMVYYQESGDEADAPPQFLQDMIARGELGVKTGKGFYSYPHPAYEEPGWLKGE